MAATRADRQERTRTILRANAATDRALQGTITRDQLRDATRARDHAGWHPILRVNQHSITVPGRDGENRRIRIERIREIK